MNSGTLNIASRLGKTKYCVLSTLMVFMCGSAPSARAQEECKKVFDAGEKLTATPHHGYQTRTSPLKGSKQETSEDISVEGAIYVQVSGKWKKSPLTVQERQKQEQENRKNAKNTSCHHVRDEVVNGEAAEVYNVHAETEYLKTDSLVWISKSKGLILRQEEDIDMGGSKPHMSVRYEYSNIHAPQL